LKAVWLARYLKIHIPAKSDTPAIRVAGVSDFNTPVRIIAGVSVFQIDLPDGELGLLIQDLAGEGLWLGL
jgi:hypothetical protein